MSNMEKTTTKLHRHKSSCTIYLQPVTVPPQPLDSESTRSTSSTVSSTPISTTPAEMSEALSLPSPAENEDTDTDASSYPDSEADSFHSSISDPNTPSQAAVQSVRTLTDNFHKLLSQATADITKLRSENLAIEEEQNNLLNVNQDLSREMDRLVSEENQWEIEREELLQVNEEFVEEVKKLYIEEEQWNLENLHLLDKRKRLEEEYCKDKNELEELVEKETKINKQQLKHLNHSLEILHADNATLKIDITKIMEYNLKTEDDLNDEFEIEKISLDESITKARKELQQVKQEREDGERQLEQLSQELDSVDMEFEEVKKENAENELKMKKTSEKQVAQINSRINKLRLENSKYELENESAANQVEELQRLESKLSLEIKQMKVENQWLISNQKTNSAKEEKAGDLGRELEQLKKQLQEEKNKVRDIAEWKTQLGHTNDQLKVENRRLCRKTEELENLVNAEATDIEEVLNMINGIQGNNTNGRRRDSDHSKFDKSYF